jgi:hypothetical protein
MIGMNNMDKWINTFPTPKDEKSFWWFYGWPFGGTDKSTLTEGPSLLFVEIWNVKGGCCGTTNGHFMYEKESLGVWQEFEGIDTPSLKELDHMLPPEVEK